MSPACWLAGWWTCWLATSPLLLRCVEMTTVSFLRCHIYVLLSTVIIIVHIRVLFISLPPVIVVFMVTIVVISQLGIIIRFIRPFPPSLPNRKGDQPYILIRRPSQDRARHDRPRGSPQMFERCSCVFFVVWRFRGPRYGYQLVALNITSWCV